MWRLSSLLKLLTLTLILSASAALPPEEKTLSPRARIRRCATQDKETLKAILRAIPQLCIFAINVCDVPGHRGFRAGTREGGYVYRGRALETFYRHARRAFEEAFEDTSEEVRKDVALRFRYLKYEAERSEGGLLADISEGRVMIGCDPFDELPQCRMAGTHAVSFDDRNLVVACPQFFTNLYPGGPLRDLFSTQIDELAMHILVADTVRRNLAPVAITDRNGRAANKYRLNEFFYKLYRLAREYLVPPGVSAYSLAPEDQ